MHTSVCRTRQKAGTVNPVYRHHNLLFSRAFTLGVVLVSIKRESIAIPGTGNDSQFLGGFSSGATEFSSFGLSDPSIPLTLLAAFSGGRRSRRDVGGHPDPGGSRSPTWPPAAAGPGEAGEGGGGPRGTRPECGRSPAAGQHPARGAHDVKYTKLN